MDHHSKIASPIPHLSQRFQTRSGAYDLEAEVKAIGTDLLIAVWGGTAPHIGAVAAAIPRQSRTDPSKTSATVMGVLCFPGHEEDEPAKSMAKKISSALNCKAIVTAGIHWDELDREGIHKVLDNCELLVQHIIQGLKKMTPRAGDHSP